MPSTTPTTFYYPYHVVMDALPRILPTCGFTVVNSDLTQGFIRIRGATTVMNAGENFTVKAGGPDAAHTVVTIESGIRLGIMTWSRTQSNFKTIMSTLQTYLDQYYAEHKAPDAPLPPPPVQAPPPPPPATPPA
jgi:hypothetical protein